MLQIAYEHFLIGEACRQLNGIGKLTAPVVADIEDQTAAEHQVGKHLVEIAVADSLREALVAYIADIVVKDPVVQPTGNFIVCTQVTTQQGVAHVGGIILVP